MYYSLIQLKRDVPPRDVAAFGRIDGYRLHKLIWDLFSDGPGRKRDFLYRYEVANGFPTFSTLSEREPTNTRDLWDIKVKDYRPKLSKGQRLAFSVRVNPVRSKRDEKDRLHRHDVVMEAKCRIGFQERPHDKRPHIATLVQEAGFAWLKARENRCGFSVEATGLRADGYLQHKMFQGRGAQPIIFSTLDLNGILTITDPEIFIQETLFKGVGPAKGFGCGLMLVRRI